MQFSKKDIATLLEHFLFCGVNAQTATAVFEKHACGVCEFSSGEIILSPTLTEKKAGLLLCGQATVSTADASKNTLLRYLHKGDLFGIANFFTDEPYVSLIRADQACRVFFITEEAICELLESDRTFLRQYLSFLSSKVCYLNRKIGYLTAGSAERRLALYLCSFEENEILFGESLSSLSVVLDLGRASLYRAFDRLVGDGYIEKDGRRIRIIHREAMLKAYQ